MSHPSVITSQPGTADQATEKEEESQTMTYQHFTASDSQTQDVIRELFPECDISHAFNDIVIAYKHGVYALCMEELIPVAIAYVAIPDQRLSTIQLYIHMTSDAPSSAYSILLDSVLVGLNGLTVCIKEPHKMYHAVLISNKFQQKDLSNVFIRI